MMDQGGRDMKILITGAGGQLGHDVVNDAAGRGHEAIAACGGVFLTAGYDVIAPFIREQAARITWGEPIIEAARAYLGSALGYMKGRDGNVHRGLPAEGYMAPISHLGSTVAFVIGCLFAKRLDGKLPGPVGVAFCGDGTTSTGAFHEAANMANVERLPLVLVVTNNQFAYSTPNIREFGEASLADRGRGYGFTVHETDGTDFMATLETFRAAVNNAREGRGPQWVLAKTLRMCGHGEHDDASYIPEELKEEYEKKDPVAIAERQLLTAGWLTPEETAVLKKQYADEVQLAVAAAQREPEPDPFRENHIIKQISNRIEVYWCKSIRLCR